MNSYAEFVGKAQAEFLSGLKQAQELNIATLASLKDLMASVPKIETADAASAKLPSPVQVVEQTFAFTNQVLEARKAYMLKLAEMADETQKQLLDAATRAAEAAKN
jgi:enoyl-CoA hydratase/carnithine racemase